MCNKKNCYIFNPEFQKNCRNLLFPFFFLKCMLVLLILITTYVFTFEHFVTLHKVSWQYIVVFPIEIWPDMLLKGNFCNMKSYSSNVNSCIWTQFLLVGICSCLGYSSDNISTFPLSTGTDTKIDFMQITYQVVSVDKDSLDGCGCWSKTETDLIIHVLLLTHCCHALTSITWVMLMKAFSKKCLWKPIWVNLI